MELTKVILNLTPADIKNAEVVYERTNARNKAHAVGTALAIAAALTEDKNAEILIKHKDGKLQQSIIPGLTLYIFEIGRVIARVLLHCQAVKNMLFFHTGVCYT